MPGTTTFGFRCKLYIDKSEDPEDPDYEELVEAVDVMLNLGFTEADASCRESNGLEVTEPGLMQVEVTGKLQWRNQAANADTAQNVLRLRADARSLVQARVLTGADDDPDARGMFGLWKVTKWPYNQDLKELLMIDFAMKPAWNTVQLVAADEGEA